MLRVSDFCRSPLSEPRCLTKDHRHRRHRRNGNGSTTIDGTESYDYHEEEAEEDDSFVVPVTLRIYSASLPAASSSSSSSSSYYQHESSFVRVPLTVLKDLALSDGDYAFIEKVVRVGITDVQPHVENSERLDHPRYCDKNTATTHNTMMGNHNHNQIPRRAKIRRKIVVRLILMDEAEEEEVEIRNRADMKYTVTNCICVPTTVMTNLGLSPEAYWNDPECGNSCSTGDDINNTINNNINRASTTNTFFQLRAIYDDDSNTEDDESSLSNTCSSSSRGHPCETNRQRRRRRRNRKRIAGHVLLRPLGRQESRVLPCFPSLRNHRHRHRHRHHHQRNDTITNDPTRSDNASSTNTNNIHPNNEEYSKYNATKDRNEKNEDTVVAVDDDEDTYNWIFPSRSGIVLQESVLFEVRYHDDANNNGNNEKTTAKVCYYEILKVQPKDDHHPAQERYNATTNYDELDDDNDDNDDTNDNDKHDNDEYFYITSSLTKFELDSEPISSLQFVRRLPPKPSCLSSSLNTSSQSFFHPPNNNNKNNKSTAKDEDEDDDDDDNLYNNNNHEQSEDINHDSYTANNPGNITISSFSRNVSGEIPKSPSRLYNNNEVPSNSGGDVSFIVDNNSLCVSPPHPDWKRVAEALIHAPTEQQIRCDSNNASCYPSPTNDCTERATTATTHILHLIGTDRDHHLRTCVEIAARQVGMSYLSIRGLAAFGYDFRRRQQQEQQNKSNPSITTTATVSNVTVGSSMIEQQLAGIDCAKEYIRTRRMEPCVLHFNDIDDELSSCDAVGDDALRCQIEDRLWTKWIEVVTPTASTSSSEVSSTIKHTTGDQQSSVLNYCYAPRVLIVISTSRPFTKKGPWLERLVFPSITLSSPNDKYIRYLWKREYYNYQHNDCDVRYFSNGNADIDEENNNAGFSSKATDTVSTFYKIDTNSGLNSSISKKIMELLRGRPAEEIVQLRRQLLQTMGSRNIVRSDSDGELLEIDDSHLEELCEKLDSKRRKLSSALSHISNVSWDDVGGLDHVRTEIMDAIELPLKYPQLFPSNSGRSGILLFGPPGTGKTLVAKAVANECGLPFLSVKGPELLGSYVGESEANIRNVFESARKAASTNLPTSAAILFFDEMDSLAPRRDGNAGTNNGGGVMERVVASLLSELDGTNGSSSEPQGRVFVLGATNRPDLLDSSLLRPGRLDRLVYLGVPTERKERMRILVSQLSKMRIEHPDGGSTNSGAAAERMASLIVDRLPPRLSGADMSKLASGSMLHAIRRLCNEAEDERKKLQEALQEHEHEGSINNRMNITIDEVLQSWGEEKCTPVITLDDLYKASKDVSPSISDEEMNRYEQLRIEHCTAPVPAFN